MKKSLEQKKEISLPVAVTEKIRKVFPSFDSSKLNKEDIKMWRAIRAGSVELDDYEEYNRSVIQAEGGRNADTSRSSRLMFVDFLGNEIQNILFHKELSKS